MLHLTALLSFLFFDIVLFKQTGVFCKAFLCFAFCFTFSTSLNTLRKLSPASFFKSSMVHIPDARRVAKSSGYLDTSSRPAGALVILKGDG